MLKQNIASTLPLILDMRDAPMTFPTINGGNHPLWILGHLAYSAEELCFEVMRGQENPLAGWKELFGYGSTPTSDSSRYPDFDDVLAECTRIHDRIGDELLEIDEEGLDRVSKGCPESYADRFGTYGVCYMAAANHWLMHRGQIADCRRAAGRKPLIA